MTCDCYVTENGTHFNEGTPKEVRNILQNSRQFGHRIRLHYGDVKTGRDYMDRYDVTGTIGRSAGTCKIPILLSNARSMGGGSVLAHCIVKITETKKPLRVLYQHPDYHVTPGA